MEILFALTALAAGLFAAFVLPVLSFLRASRAMSEAAHLRARVAVLEDQLRDLAAAARTHAARERRAAAPTAAEPPARETPPAGVEPVAPVQPTPPEGPGTPPLVPFQPAVSPGPLTPGSVPPPPPASPPTEAAPASGSEAGAFEEAIGGRVLLYVGTVVLVLGAAFFLKYAFDREWITEWMRVALGAVGGAALVVGGGRLTRGGYATYGQVLTGGGLAVLYLAAYAAFGFYALIGSTLAFALLTAVTVLAAVLADRQQSQPMASMATGGGFLTPFLVGGTTDAQVTLFSYVALLVLGTSFLARRRGWPLLNLLGYAFTIVTVAAWADAYYTRAKYLRTEIFLTLFCGLFIAALVHAWRLSSTQGRLAAAVLASAPLLYHVASLGILASHGVAFLVYVIAFTVVSVGWATRRAPAEMRVLLWLAVMLPLVSWMDVHQARTWVAPSLVTLGAVFALHLLGQIDRIERLRGALGTVDLLLLHLNGLGLFLGVYVLLERQAVGWVPGIGLVLVALHAVLARWLRPRDQHAALHALAVSFSLLAATIGVHLDGAWLTAAWAAEGAAVAWIGLRIDRQWFRVAGAALVAVAAGRWLALSVAQPAPANFRLFANEATALGACLIALLYLLAWAHHARRSPERKYARSIAALVVAASVATVILLTAQNQAYWDIRGASYADATFARQLVLSLIWASYAGLLITIGIRRGYRPIRYAAMVLFGLTVLKVFAVDLAGLEGIYRVLGLLAVGSILLLVSFLYQQRGRADGKPAR